MLTGLAPAGSIKVNDLTRPGWRAVKVEVITPPNESPTRLIGRVKRRASKRSVSCLIEEIDVVA